MKYEYKPGYRYKLRNGEIVTIKVDGVSPYFSDGLYRNSDGDCVNVTVPGLSIIEELSPEEEQMEPTQEPRYTVKQMEDALNSAAISYWMSPDATFLAKLGRNDYVEEKKEEPIYEPFDIDRAKAGDEILFYCSISKSYMPAILLKEFEGYSAKKAYALAVRRSEKGNDLFIASEDGEVYENSGRVLGRLVMAPKTGKSEEQSVESNKDQSYEPFDLERAKAGDEVLFKTRSGEFANTRIVSFNGRASYPIVAVVGDGNGLLYEFDLKGFSQGLIDSAHLVMAPKTREVEIKVFKGMSGSVFVVGNEADVFFNPPPTWTEIDRFTHTVKV